MKWGGKRSWRPIEPKETKAGQPIARRAARPSLILILFFVTMLYCACAMLDSAGVEPLGAFLLVGAWSSIAASETDADSPLNQTLMDKIRGNLDYLYDFHNPNLFYKGSKVIDETAGTLYDWGTGNAYVEQDTGAGGTETMIDEIRFYIPASASQVTVRAKLQAEADNVSVSFKFHITDGVNTATTEQASVGTSAEWFSVVLDVSSVSGWCAFSIDSYTAAGVLDARWHRVYTIFGYISG